MREVEDFFKDADLRPNFAQSVSSCYFCRMIPIEQLVEFGALKKTLKKGDFLFSQGDTARFYFQVLKGEMKMNNYNDEGKEFLQGIFTNGESFGEPPLLIDEKYPANAEALTDVELLALPK